MNTMLTLCLLVGGLTAEPDQKSGPDPNKMQAVFKTIYGDLVFEFDVTLAQENVNKVCELIAAGVYDGTHFCRIEPGFVIQLANAEDRLTPLRPDQANRIRKLKAEFGPTRHRKGIISMAREDADPNTAATSFSILLGDAPHLDGKYTVVGEITHGWEVLELFQQVPRTGSKPGIRLTVLEAKLIKPGSPLPPLTVGKIDPSSLAQAASNVASGTIRQPWDRTEIAAIVVGLMIVMGLSHTFLSGRVAPARLRSLNLLGVLVGAFLLLILATPIAHYLPSVGVVLFFGLIGLFKLMGQFEFTA